MGELKNLAAEKPMVPMEPKTVNVSWKHKKDKDAMLESVIYALHQSGHYFVKPEDIEEISYDSKKHGDWPTVLTNKYEFTYNPSCNRYIKYYRDRTLEYARNDSYASAIAKATNAWRNFRGTIASTGASNVEIKKAVMLNNCSDHELEYFKNYAFAVSEAIDALNNCGETISSTEATNMKIEKVIFNEPATIVYWQDGTKTVVKCQEGDTFSKETGLAMAIAKKALGNEGNFNDIFRKWVE